MVCVQEKTKLRRYDYMLDVGSLSKDMLELLGSYLVLKEVELYLEEHGTISLETYKEIVNKEVAILD